MSYDFIAIGQQLESRQFIGNYFAKQYVHHLNQYKDVILLHPHETTLVDDLQSLNEAMVASNYNKWLGYQYEPMVGVSIWAVLNMNTTDAFVFGEYHFEIQKVHHTLNTVELIVQPVRPITPSAGIITDLSIGSLLFDSQQHIVEWLVALDVWTFRTYRTSRAALVQFCQNDINWPNIKHWLYLLGLLCIAGAKSSVGIIWSLGEFSLRFINALERLLRAATPIALAILMLLSKIIGGAYILLAMIWRDLFGNNNPVDRRTRASVSNPGYGRPPPAYRQQQYNRRVQWHAR